MADIQRLPLPIVNNWDWQAAGSCRGMDSDAFFHPPQERAKGRRRRISASKAVCKACPVIQQCLEEDERAERLGLQSLRYPAARASRSVRPPATTGPLAAGPVLGSPVGSTVGSTVGSAVESVDPVAGPVG